MAILYVQPVQRWPVLGLHGQRLGTVETCALDPDTGKVKHLVLRTQWQTIDIEWPYLVFREEHQSFQLIGSDAPEQ